MRYLFQIINCNNCVTKMHEIKINLKKKWDLSIQKMPYRWEVIISTPSSPPKNDKAAKHCVKVCSCADSTTPPATATVSGSAV